MRYILIDKDSMVVACSDFPDSPEPPAWTYPEDLTLVRADDFEFPDGDFWNYKYVDGTFVYVEPDPEPLSPAEVFQAMFIADPESLDILDDADLARMAPYMAEWDATDIYEVGAKVQYLALPYRCLQAHQAQPTWNPADAPSLWARILIPDSTVIPEWEQPDSTNPYMKGDKVKHNGKTWISDVDSNVWEPGVYGWSEVAS